MREIPSFPGSLEEAHPPHLAAFDAAFRQDGGRLKERDDLMQWYRLRYWHYVKVLRKSPLHKPFLERFHFDLVANEHLNATASRYGGTHLIGLNVGTILNLETFFSMLLSHPKVLPEVGDCSREMQWISSLSACDWRQPCKTALKGAALLQEPPSSFPLDEARRLYAHRLAILSVDFVFFHEMGHLANGHIEFLETRGRGAALRELESGGPPAADEALDLQALEFNADSHAILVLTRDWLRLPERLDAANPFETATEAIESLALAAVAVFLLFDPLATRIRDYGRAAHPHPAVRLMNVGLMMWSAAKKAAPSGLERVQAAWLLGLQRAEAICTELQVGSAVWNAIDVESAAVSAEYQRIASHFQTLDQALRPDLRRHRN
ncbi:MAG TPA: hypothetical protein VLU25_09985 [Acidobacteriota bacterium]|nr:hypothetical protein [Acidobacteriota bacterium]